MRIRFLAQKRWRFPVGPCGEGFARSNEGALSSTGSAWVCCIVYTNSIPFQAHHAKKHMKITQRCDESSCQILNMLFSLDQSKARAKMAAAQFLDTSCAGRRVKKFIFVSTAVTKVFFKKQFSGKVQVVGVLRRECWAEE